MSQSRLIELSYYAPSAQVRLSAYADTVVLDHNSKGGIISAVRFGGYPEMVRAMSDAIYGGATIEATQNSTTRMLQSNVKGYQRQMSHDGVYAVATLMASDDAQTDERSSKDDGGGAVEAQETMQPRKCYIFCPQGDRDRLFEELDHKTAAPLIPAFRDYVLDALQKRGDLRQLEVISLKEKMDAWVLDLKPEDRNVVEVLESGLKAGIIQIPGALPGAPDGFDGVENVTGYLNTFGVTVADRIRNQFMPLFDPANEPLSTEVLAINDCIMSRAGYSLYDAQLAVAEAVKRQLDRKSVALIIAECGAGKTKIGSTALGALHGLWAAQKRSGTDKSFGIIMCPSHVTRKWVREIGETLPDTYATVVHSIAELDQLYAMYKQGDMLASPKTLPLFLRKYQRRQIKQYQRREPIYKGAGDIICCLDESGSTTGQPAAWGKAVALTLLEIAESEGRKFALIHFSGPENVKTDIFIPKQYTLEDKLRAAETFLDGGTDFHSPLKEALRLMQEEHFENADLVFITDGECELPESCITALHTVQIERRFTVTGVLLDEDNAGMDFSLKPFCQNIYRTCELTGKQIIQNLLL